MEDSSERSLEHMAFCVFAGEIEALVYKFVEHFPNEQDMVSDLRNSNYQLYTSV